MAIWIPLFSGWRYNIGKLAAYDVLCCILYSTNLLVNSVPEVGSDTHVKIFLILQTFNRLPWRFQR
jgi:hypothetical protein